MSLNEEQITLILDESAGFDGTHLIIPLCDIRANCFYPVKYLKFLAWAIYWLEGTIKLNGQVVQVEDQLTTGAVYTFHLEAPRDRKFYLPVFMIDHFAD